ncbi:hypothetical protein GGI09_000753 [Coemansia sp. S100]|nr:hypothetical protein GGI09_000753 [Coemansia sp. S100]
MLDSQNSSIDESHLKPDIVFAFKGQVDATFRDVFMLLEVKGQKAGPKAQHEHFSQVADYALALWNNQPTRTLVPILFFHGALLDLLALFVGIGHDGAQAHESEESPNPTEEEFSSEDL